MIKPIASFPDKTFFYRRSSVYEIQGGKLLYSSLIDYKKHLSCSWCQKGQCRENKAPVCDYGRCSVQKIYALQDAYSVVLCGKPKIYVPWDTLQEEFPNIERKQIKRFFDIHSRKDHIFLDPWKEKKFERAKSTLSQELIDAVEFLKAASREWKVSAVQVCDVEAAGFDSIRHDEDNNPAHVEICQEGFSGGDLMGACIKLADKMILVR